MDHQRFDALAAGFARAISRRGALRALAGGLAGGLLSPAARVAAKPRTCQGSGQACGPRQGCCSPPCCGGVCCGEADVCLHHGLETEPHRAKPVCCPATQAAIDRCCAPGEIGCYKTCCPPETIACGAPTKLPDGTVLPGTCVCPEGMVYQNGACLCLGVGESCPQGGGCCGSGVCVCPSKPPCDPEFLVCNAGLGEPCPSDDLCSYSCCFDGICCKGLGFPCQGEGECCPGLPCTNGQCGFGVGEACSVHCDCVTGGCDNGACCIFSADDRFTCTADDQCCFGAVCGPGGDCCMPSGGPCGNFLDCCSGDCQNFTTCA